MSSIIGGAILAVMGAMLLIGWRRIHANLPPRNAERRQFWYSGVNPWRVIGIGLVCLVAGVAFLVYGLLVINHR